MIRREIFLLLSVLLIGFAEIACYADQDTGTPSPAGYTSGSSTGRHHGSHRQGGAPGAAAQPSRPLTDDEIKRNVLQAFSDEPDLSGLNLDAQVAGGTATLSGKVAKQSQKVIASDAARNAAGVKKLVNKIEIEKKPRSKNDDQTKKTSKS